jgi:hypothetical protein
MFHPHLLKMAQGWWFQPLWKILVRFDHHPVPIGENKKNHGSSHHQPDPLAMTNSLPWKISIFHRFPWLPSCSSESRTSAWTRDFYENCDWETLPFIPWNKDMLYIYIVNWHQSVIPIFLTNIDLYWPYHWDSLGLLTVYRHCQLTNISEWVPHFSPCLLIK